MYYTAQQRPIERQRPAFGSRSLEVEAGINQAHVVYTPEQCVQLANRLRWILVREREKENRQNEKR